MKFYKICAVAFISVCFFNITFSQQTLAVYRGSVPLDKHLYTYIQSHGKEILERTCLNGCFFVKFNVNQDGEITKLASNSGAIPSLDSIVKAAILETRGKWNVPKNVKDIPFLLPVIFNTGYCITGGPKTASQILASLPTINDTSAIKVSSEKGMVSNFMHMIDFREKSELANSNPVECALLLPIYLTAPKL